ncbi:MAG: ribonuclease P [Methanosarcinaceae archaeon]|nr:ribonuclease P [Methanosarcinaceae archaeon]
MYMRVRKKNKTLSKRVAYERINILFRLAEKNYKTNPERSDRYVNLIRQISMRQRVKIPRHIKRRICKYCYSFLVPGSNCRVRLKGEYVLTTCYNCGRKVHFPYN